MPSKELYGLNCMWFPSDEASVDIERFLLFKLYEGASKSFRIGRLERELQMVQLFATRYSCIAILWVSLVSFVAITLCVASERVFIVVYFVIDSDWKLLDIPSYMFFWSPSDYQTARTKRNGGRETEGFNFIDISPIFSSFFSAVRRVNSNIDTKSNFPTSIYSIMFLFLIWHYELFAWRT
jgi:hypothetical protein